MVREYVLGVYEDEGKLFDSIKRLRGSGFEIHDVHTPYAVHGLDDAIGHRRSRLPIVTFIAGLFGTIFALFMQFWTMGVNWPIDVGGKPNDSALAFLPVTFEITVLLAGLMTAAAFLFRSGLFPGAKANLLDAEITNHRFVVVLYHKNAGFDPQLAKRIFEETGAVRVSEKAVVA